MAEALERERERSREVVDDCGVLRCLLPSEGMKKRGHCTSLHSSPIIASFSESSAIPEARTKRKCDGKVVGYQSRIRREWKFRSPEVTQTSGLPGESAARASTGVVQQTLSTSTVTFDLCRKMLYLVCGCRLQTGASSKDPSLV
jgi:hypothetical protein